MITGHLMPRIHFIRFATSVIACGCEAGIESKLLPNQTPDGRPGVSVLVFSMSSKELAKQILNRTGQCLMTTPTSAVFSGNSGRKKNSSRKFFKILRRWISDSKKC